MKKLIILCILLSGCGPKPLKPNDCVYFAPNNMYKIIKVIGKDIYQAKDAKDSKYILNSDSPDASLKQVTCDIFEENKADYEKQQAEEKERCKKNGCISFVVRE